MLRAQFTLLLSYCALLTGPASQLYRVIDAWQNLPSIGRAIEADARERPLILLAPDETTRALIDMYARTVVEFIPGPVEPEALERLKQRMASEPRTVVVVQLSGRNLTPTFQRVASAFDRAAGRAIDSGEDEPRWSAALGLRIVRRYALPNGRRYALLERAG
jgi:hypothetical protein